MSTVKCNHTIWLTIAFLLLCIFAIFSCVSALRSYSFDFVDLFHGKWHIIAIEWKGQTKTKWLKYSFEFCIKSTSLHKSSVPCILIGHFDMKLTNSRWHKYIYLLAQSMQNVYERHIFSFHLSLFMHISECFFILAYYGVLKSLCRTRASLCNLHCVVYSLKFANIAMKRKKWNQTEIKKKLSNAQLKNVPLRVTCAHSFDSVKKFAFSCKHTHA